MPQRPIFQVRQSVARVFRSSGEYFNEHEREMLGCGLALMPRGAALDHQVGVLLNAFTLGSLVLRRYRPPLALKMGSRGLEANATAAYAV